VQPLYINAVLTAVVPSRPLSYSVSGTQGGLDGVFIMISIAA